MMLYQYFLLTIFFELISSQSESGDKCVLPNNAKGKCKHIHDCTSVIENIGVGIHPQHCGFDGVIPIVCCPIRKSDEKCEEYGKEVAGLVVYSIVGGTDALIKEYPHMVALGYGNDNKISWQCGGSLISKTFVLTAAHCLTSQELGDVKIARLGDILLNGPSDLNRDFKILRRIPHPEFRPPVSYNDIALLELETPVKYTYTIKPSCLHTQPTVNSSFLKALTATGWGLTQFGGSASNILQKVDLDIFTNEECKKIFKINKRKYPQGILEEKQICAGGRNEEKDTCQGDSGGPLQFKKFEEGLYGIIGITSFGKVCGSANIPGVYTKVYYYVSWIESVVWP